MNESENSRNPIPENKAAILRWKRVATFIVYETNKILGNAEELFKLGLKSRDALHLAAAADGNVDVFITTDDGILRKVSNLEGLIVANPVDAIVKVNDYVN